ncbi:MAG TPA: DUF4389 domain-containing protein [Chromatiales bacterium]|nr:DUF4389 domain-containing protein [Chromatiales bacterium]HEX22142.1 DUF4389 domain-containing protein [Chromatiales bacterium]
MDTEQKENMTPQEAWTRGLFMLMFFILLQLAKIVAGVVVVLQFLFTIFTNQTNDNLLHFGASLSLYIYQIWRFLTYNTETQPFPFAPWPDAQAAMELEEAVIQDEPDEPGTSGDNAGQRAPGKD